MTKMPPDIRRTFAAALAFLALLCLPQLNEKAVAGSFFYYNPDSTQNNLPNLKRRVDAFVSAKGLAFTFQPFTRFLDFDRQVKESRPSLLFLPDWYLQQNGNSRKFKPFLVPVYMGTTTYRKALLVAADSTLTFDQLSGVSMTMTPVNEAGLAMLNQAIFKEKGLDAAALNIITVDKDTDALFALALGQVEAALISQENLKIIEGINTRILAAVKTLAVSAPIPRPVLCYAEGEIDAEELEILRVSLLAGKNDPFTAKIMELLNVDAWQPIPPLQ